MTDRKGYVPEASPNPRVVFAANLRIRQNGAGFQAVHGDRQHVEKVDCFDDRKPSQRSCFCLRRFGPVNDTTLGGHGGGKFGTQPADHMACALLIQS